MNTACKFHVKKAWKWKYLNLEWKQALLSCPHTPPKAKYLGLGAETVWDGYDSRNGVKTKKAAGQWQSLEAG